MGGIHTFSFLAGRGTRVAFFALVAGLFWAAGTPAVRAQQGAGLPEDERIGPAELFELKQQWQKEAPVIDQNYDAVVDQNDLLILHCLWHEKEPFENPYTEGRAVGIYAAWEQGGRRFTSNEIEVQIADSTADFKPTVVNSGSLALNQMDSSRSKASDAPSAGRVFDPAALAGDPELFEELMARLRGCENPCQGVSKVVGSAQSPRLGVASEQIGTFWGWTLWVGWDASWSETYVPEGESYAMVAYFAPEGVYFALQRSEFVYSGVDVFAGVGAFMGAAASPGRQYFTKTSLGNSVGISLSYGMKLIPTFSYAPVPSLSHGITFFRDGSSDSLQHAIQLGCGASVNLSLLPFSLPVGVQLGRECKDPPTPCGVYSGFWPVILWGLDPSAGGSPLDVIIQGLEQLASLQETDYAAILGKEFANILLPIFYHLQAPGPVTLEDDVPPPSNAYYFSEFLQNPAFPSSSPNTSINHMIKDAEQWLASGDTQGLRESIRDNMQHDGPLFYEYAKSLEAGTKLGLELGEKHGYDLAVEEGRREDDKIFVDGVETVPCPVGEWCAVIVGATEIAELFPGSQVEDLEGAWVRFDRDALSYLDLQGDEYAWAQIEDGLAVYEFVLRSNAPVLIGPFIHKDDNPIGNKHVELRRRKVVPADRALLYSTGVALTGVSTTLRCVALDENGIPLTEGTPVQFFDYRDRLIGTGAQTKDELVATDLMLKPSIPRIIKVTTTQVGYTEEDTTTGFSVEGRGFSVDADLLIDGVSINTMSHWEWAVLSSKNILARPVEEQYRLTQTTTIQVVNPEGIASNGYVYTP
ncbi:MAG TPA: hypothetical protein ENN74_01260 [Firmicutes bacterium]|nr:hypothetical protein [Bacillota bacterium]